jgi:hypothetical protein
MAVSDQRHAPAALYPGERPPVPIIQEAVGPTAGLDTEAKEKIVCLCQGSNLGRPVRIHILYCLSYNGS